MPRFERLIGKPKHLFFQRKRIGEFSRSFGQGHLQYLAFEITTAYFMQYRFDKRQSTERDQHHLRGIESLQQLLKQFTILFLILFIIDYWMKMKPHQRAFFRHLFRRAKAFLQRCRQMLFMIDNGLRIE